MRHRVMNLAAENDATYENWLRLGECIVTEKLRPMNHYLNPFYDKSEEKENINYINYIRELGSMTDLEYEFWIRDLKNKFSKNRSLGPATKVINKYAGTKQIYENLREACEDNDVKYSNLLELFNNEKSNKVKYKGLIFEKLK